MIILVRQYFCHFFVCKHAHGRRDVIFTRYICVRSVSHKPRKTCYQRAVIPHSTYARQRLALLQTRLHCPT